MKNTKESYELTYKTMKTGDQVYRDLSNLATSQKKNYNRSMTKDKKKDRIRTE